MKNNDEIRQANRKALPKFLLFEAVGLVLGGVISFLGAKTLMAVGVDYAVAALAEWGTAFAVGAAPWLLAICAAAQLLCGLVFTARGRSVLAGWDGEDEIVSDRADWILSVGLWVNSLLMILAFFLFAAFYSVGLTANTVSKVRSLGTLAAFFAALVITIIFQQRFVDLTKRIYPEKKASVYDPRFQKEWFAQCDEAERAVIGQCAYRAYQAVNKTCLVLWMVFTIAGMFLGTGFLPVLAICAIWAIGGSVYTWWSMKLSPRTLGT